MKRALLAVFLAIAVPAIAQQQPPAQPQTPQEPTKERRQLDLRLDNPSSFATTAPTEKEPPKVLPTLGGDARRIEPAPGVAGVRTENPTFPKDTNPGR